MTNLAQNLILGQTVFEMSNKSTIASENEIYKQFCSNNEIIDILRMAVHNLEARNLD